MGLVASMGGNGYAGLVGNKSVILKPIFKKYDKRGLAGFFCLRTGLSGVL